MNNLNFIELRCGAKVTCISENGTIANVDDIKKEIESGLEDVLADVVNNYNNVFDFNLIECVVMDNGSDTSK